MNQTEKIKFDEILDNIKKRFSKELTENTLGIVVKKDKDSEKFNIYDKETGKLLIVEVGEYDLQCLFEWIGYSLLASIRTQMEIDDNSDSVKELAEQQKKAQKEYEEKYIKVCPFCGQEYDSKHERHDHIGFRYP